MTDLQHAARKAREHIDGAALLALVTLWLLFFIPNHRGNFVWWLGEVPDFPKAWRPVAAPLLVLLPLIGCLALFVTRKKWRSGILVASGLCLATGVALSWPPPYVASALAALLAALVAYYAWSDRQRTIVLCTLGGLVAVQLALAVGCYFFEPSPFVSPEVGKRADGLFSTPLAFYVFPVIGFCLGGEAWQHTRTRWLGGGLLLVSAVIVAMTVTRAAGLGIVAAGLLFLLRDRRGLPLLVATVTLGVILLARGTTPAAVASTGRSTAARPALWTLAVRAVGSAPLTGNGGLSFVRSDATAPYLRAGWAPGDYENLYLNTAADSGLPAALGLTVLIGFAVFRRPARGRSSMAAASAALCASGMFDVQLFGGPSVWCASVFWGTVIGAALRD